MPMLEQIIEALLLVSEKPITLDRLTGMLSRATKPDNRDFEHTVETDKKNDSAKEDTQSQSIQDAITAIQARYQQGGVLELREVAGGYRIQINSEFGPWIDLLQEDRPQKYSRALLETLAIIAYRQPVTRGDIEDIRGVAVSSHIIRALQEREWIRVVGHKDVPGKPGLYATTKQFLDYFNLTSLEQLPPLAEVRDLAEVARSLQDVQKTGDSDYAKDVSSGVSVQ